MPASSQLTNVGLYVAKSRISGVGVFASRSFQKGDIVEQAPVLRLQHPDEVLEDYVLSGNRLCLGYGAIYNHSSEPNVRQRCEGDVCTFTALRTIGVDDELRIDYGGEWWTARNRVPLSSYSRKPPA